jgi:heme exporter protein A
MTAFIEFQDLAVARGDRILLKGLRNELRPGEVLHIRGSNGVGKTSLLEVLGGLREPEEGAVVRSSDPEHCHWIGHRNALNPAMSPAENLAFWCAVQDEPAARIYDALREFGLQRVTDQPCRQLSAGQRRRAALARLVVAERPLWFLDEPLSALDESGVRQWLDVTQRHLRRGGAAVVTSHQALPGPLPGLRTWELG